MPTKKYNNVKTKARGTPYQLHPTHDMVKAITEAADVSPDEIVKARGWGWLARLIISALKLYAEVQKEKNGRKNPTPIGTGG